MAMFNRNALPEEFQAEHGSIDLEDSSSSSKPSAAGAAADDREDEDLDLACAGQRVWLCKVPRFLLDKWQQSSREGEILGRVRVYDESVPLSPEREKRVDPLLVCRKTPDGNAKISVLLNEHSSSAESKPDLKGKRPQQQPQGDGLPTEYKLTMQNTASKNLYVFGEKVQDDLDSGEEGARKKRRAFSFLPPSSGSSSPSLSPPKRC